MHTLSFMSVFSNTSCLTRGPGPGSMCAPLTLYPLRNPGLRETRSSGIETHFTQPLPPGNAGVSGHLGESQLISQNSMHHLSNYLIANELPEKRCNRQFLQRWVPPMMSDVQKRIRHSTFVKCPLTMIGRRSNERRLCVGAMHRKDF